MNSKIFPSLWLSACLALAGSPHAAESPTVPSSMAAGGARLTTQPAAAETDPATPQRQAFWNRELGSAAAYDKSIQPNRDRLRRMVGAIDPRSTSGLLPATETNRLDQTDSVLFERARWPVFDGVWAEGLRLRPRTPPVAWVVAVPDADQTPEMLAGLAPGLAPERQFARRLAEQGCEVLVPVILDRARAQPTNSAPPLSRRDFICRQAFPLGRHVLGYEIQKVLAALDLLCAGAAKGTNAPPKLAVAGYGEGGLIAFYSAALDTRITATLVSGYFDSHTNLTIEPFSRTLFGLRREFGDAEIATLIAPRALVVEFSPPPQPLETETAPNPAKSDPPDFESVEAEFDRTRSLLKQGEPAGLLRFTLICGAEGMATGPGSDRALAALLKDLGIPLEQIKPTGTLPQPAADASTMADRQQRQFDQLEAFTRHLGEKIERGE